MMDTILSATNALLSSTPSLCDYAAKTGHLAKLVTLMDNSSLPQQPTAIGLVNIFVNSQLCVETLGTTPCSIRSILQYLECDDSKSILRAADTLDKALKKNLCASESACLVSQLLSCEGVPRMLKVLEGSYDMKLATDASEAKARIVSALQAGLKDTVHSERL